jgi:hypothetical protein
MRKIALVYAGLVVILVLGLPVTPACALANNTVSYVSGSGDSNINNNCSDQTNPCATFVQALENTADKGTVMCVGTGVVDFGGTTIAKSVTIDCGTASFFSLGNMTIDGAGIIVRLRNLSFDGAGIQPVNNSNFAIVVAQVAELYIENCRINNFSGTAPSIGINFAPSGSTRSRLTIADSVITRNASKGIFVQPSGSGLTQVTIVRTRVEGNGAGIQVDGTNSSGQVQVQVKDSVFANNVSGALAFSSPSALAVISLSTPWPRATTLAWGPPALLPWSSSTEQRSRRAHRKP